MADANIQAAGEKVKTVKRSLKKQVPQSEFGGPQKAPSGFFLFGNSVRAKITEDLRANLKEGESFKVSSVASVVGVQWKALGEEGQKKFNDESAALKVKYDADYAAWQLTPEYKKFLHVSALHRKKQADKKALVKAQANGMPKRPMTAYFLFGNEVRESVKAELEQKGEKYSIQTAAPIQKAKWEALGAEGQKVYQDQSVAAKTKYEEDMKAWELTDAGKEYAKAKKVAAKRKQVNQRGGPKAKRAKKDGAAGGDAEEDEEEISSEIEFEDDGAEEGEAGAEEEVAEDEEAEA